MKTGRDLSTARYYALFLDRSRGKVDFTQAQAELAEVLAKNPEFDVEKFRIFLDVGSIDPTDEVSLTHAILTDPLLYAVYQLGRSVQLDEDKMRAEDEPCVMSDCQCSCQ